MSAQATTTIDWTPWLLPLRRPVVIAAEHTPLQHRQGVLLRVTGDDPDRGPLYADACPLPGLSGDAYDDVIVALSGRVDARLPPALDWAVYASSCWSPSTIIMKVAVLIDGELDALGAIDDGATVKLKVGRRPIAEDLERVATVAAIARQRRGKLRLDGNRRLDVDAAVALAAAAGDVLEFFEEPTMVSKLKQLPSSFPLALDEWFDELAARGGVHKLPRATAWVIKPTVLGASTTLEIVRAAMSAKIAVVVSSAYESAVGRHGLACFARFVDNLLRTNTVVHGLGTGPAFADDIDLSVLDALPWRRWR